MVLVHVAHHRRRERLDRVDAGGEEVLRADDARARKPSHEVDRLQLPHAEEGEVAEVDPEGVRVLLLVELSQAVPLRLLLAAALHVSDERHAAVCGAFEPFGRYTQRRLPAVGRQQILGVARHAGEAEDWQPGLILCEPHQRARRVARDSRRERREDCIPRAVRDERARVLRLAQPRGVALVLHHRRLHLLLLLRELGLAGDRVAAAATRAQPVFICAFRRAGERAVMAEGDGP
mmetsp:Transcript_13549/g.33836  ORF Transcript_13549/g.33836 Transcript_13549/m.33836 type:complete len:234 (+) Transcript_13549:636-1337(+)